MTTTKINYGKVGRVSMEVGSPNYAFNGATTTDNVGVPVPIIFGEHKASGNIINQFIYNSGDKSYMNMLLAICEGEIESLTNHKINEIPIAQLSGSTVETKLGTNAQTVIPNFNDQHNIYNIDAEIANAGVYNYQTQDSDIEAFEVNFSLPNGLYILDTETFNKSQFVIDINVEYKLVADATYTLTNQNVWSLSENNMRIKIRVDGLTKGKYDIQITKITRTDNPAGYTSLIRTSTLYLDSVDEIKTDDIAHPNTVLAGYKLLSVEQLTGNTPNITMTVKGLKVLIPDVKYGGNAIAWDLYYWDGTSEFKRLSDSASCTWDGTTYIEAWTANPIWCIKALLLSKRFGLGDYFDASMIDAASFLEMAKYCDERVPDGNGSYEKRFSFDVILDSTMYPMDILEQLLQTCRGKKHYSDGVVKIRIDKPGTVVGFFGMGSIISGSFIQIWRPLKDVPNVVDVTYNDKTKDWSEETVDYVDADSLDAGDPIRRKSIRLFLTRTSQAIREARYQLKYLKYTQRTLEFKTGINATGLEVGDLIAISHDVPQWGFSGRVKAGSTTTKVKLDRSVTVQAATTYKLLVYFRSNDTWEEKTVTDAAGTYTELNITTALSKAPAAYDEYAFGVSGSNTKTFRITRIDEDNKNEFKITADEYNALIYDDSVVTLPDNNYSALLNTIPDVADLTITEGIAKTKDGNIDNLINVYFQPPILEDYFIKKYAKARIYLKESAGEYILKGEVLHPGGFFQIMGGLNNLTDYTVCVVSVDDKGKSNAIIDSPTATVTVLGLTAPPSIVTGFDASQESNLLKFNWNPNEEVDLARYILKKGSEWNTGTIIAELVDSTSFIYPVSELGIQTYMIKAIDTSGNESVSPAIDSLDVSAPPDMSFMNLYDVWKQNIEYKLTNLSAYMRNDFDSGYNRVTLGLSTAETWEEWEASGSTWEADESNVFCELDAGAFEASGSLELVTPIDLEAIFPFKIISDPDYLNVNGGTFTLQINYSEDNATWSGFADVDPDFLYRARYVLFKLLLATTDTNYNIYLNKLYAYIYAPMVITDWISDVAIPLAGKDIYYSATFSVVPRIIANITNGVLGVVKISNKTVTKFTARCYNVSGSAIDTAEIDCDIKGF